jgi:uncharacterized protein with HEPN domain
MSENNRLPDYLDHIKQAALDACSFVDAMDEASFLADKRTQSAVVMSLVIMGEASTKVMDRHAEFAQRHTNIPWRSMRGMRNRIAHGYFEIDLDLVWDTVQTALPALLDQLEKTRAQLDSENAASGRSLPPSD